MPVKGKIRESLELGLKNSTWSHHIQLFRDAISELGEAEAEQESTEKAKREAVKDIISYLLPDEERSYSENPSDGHIYIKLIKAIELFGIDGAEFPKEEQENASFIPEGQEHEIRCNYLECDWGMGLGGSGYCSGHGNPRNANCPKFTTGAGDYNPEISRRKEFFESLKKLEKQDPARVKRMREACGGDALKMYSMFGT